MNATVQRIGALAACFVAGIIAVCWRMEIRAAGSRDPEVVTNRLDQSETKIVSSWDQKAAAAYLDQRAAWWMEWPKAARDHETFCVSCHTAVPYALSRPALRKSLAEAAPSANERRLLDNVTKRVRLWKEVAPFYSDADRGIYKTVESRGTESVLNALMLVSNDAQGGQLSNDTRTALDNMWAEQQTTGIKRARGCGCASPMSRGKRTIQITMEPLLPRSRRARPRGITTRDLKSKITSRCCANT